MLHLNISLPSRPHSPLTMGLLSPKRAIITHPLSSPTSIVSCPLLVALCFPFLLLMSSSNCLLTTLSSVLFTIPMNWNPIRLIRINALVNSQTAALMELKVAKQAKAEEELVSAMRTSNQAI